MSYCSRVYRHRNVHSHDEGAKEPFFSKQNDINKSGQKNSFFQTKLSVNEPGDKYEQEADSVANAVVNSKTSAPVLQQKKITGIQRLSTSKEDEKLSTNDARMARDKEIQEKPMQQITGGPEKEKEKDIQKMGDSMKEEKDKKKSSAIQAKQDPGAGNAASDVSSKIANSAGRGSALPQKALHEMSSSFGVDFSGVRVHKDSDAVNMNKELQAQAFTHGSDIYFNQGKYNPENSEGKFLLAHELTHVVQQNSSIQTKSIQRTIGDGHDLTAERFAGDIELEAVFDGEKLLKSGASGNGVRKIQQALIDLGFNLNQFGADGKFGNETKSAVIQFQTSNGLLRDGIVGSITMTKLNTESQPIPPSPNVLPICPTEETSFKLASNSNDVGGPAIPGVNCQSPIVPPNPIPQPVPVPLTMKCDSNGFSRQDFLARNGNNKDELGRTSITSSPAILNPSLLKFQQQKGKTVSLLPFQVSLPVVQSLFTQAGDFFEDTSKFFCQQNCDCKSGDYPLKWRILKDGAEKIKAGEQEHCDDFNLSYQLSIFRLATLVNQLSATQQIFADEITARNQIRQAIGFDADSWLSKFNCLNNLSVKRRDKSSPPFHAPIRRIKIPDIATGCKFMELRISSGSFPEIGNHPSVNVVTISQC